MVAGALALVMWGGMWGGGRAGGVHGEGCWLGLIEVLWVGAGVYRGSAMVGLEQIRVQGESVRDM